MGSPSLRTFRNRIDRAEMEAASLSGEEVQIRRLFQVTEAGRHWGARKSLQPQQGSVNASLISSARCPSRGVRRTWRVLVLPRVMGILGIQEMKAGGRGGGWEGRGVDTYSQCFAFAQKRALAP